MSYKNSTVWALYYVINLGASSYLKKTIRLGPRSCVRGLDMMLMPGPRVVDLMLVSVVVINNLVIETVPRRPCARSTNSTTR